MAKNQGAGCLKVGLLGCGGVLAVMVVFALTAVGIASLGVRGQKPENRVLTPEIPGVRDSGSTEVDSPVGPGSAGGGSGRVILDLRRVETTVTTAKEGEGLRVEADYEPGDYALEERLETADDGTWVYTLAFRPDGSGGLEMLRRLLGGHSPSIRVYLPRDTPIELAMDIDSGGAELAMEDLRLRTLDLELNKAGIVLEFPRPLREPMERLSIHGSMGGVAVQQVGNASPRVLDVDLSMGGMMLDLRGSWAADAEILINTRMAGGELRLPSNVTIVGLPGHTMTVEPDAEVPPPTLRFDAAGELGDLEIRR